MLEKEMNTLGSAIGDFSLSEFTQLRAWYRCHSHQNFIVQTTLMDPMGVNFLGASHRCAQFLTYSKYWLRLHTGWSMFTQQSLCPTTTPCAQRPCFSLAVSEFIDYMSSWSHIRASHDVDDVGTQGPENSAGYKERLNSYFELCPQSLKTRTPIHPCLNGCCGSLDQTLCKFEERGSSIFFNRKLESPQTNKWLKAWHITDWLYSGLNLHGGFLKHTWRAAFSKIKFDDETKTKPGQPHSMNAVSGKACKLTQSFLDEAAAPFDVEVYVIATEAVRVLTLFFLNLLSSKRNFAGSGVCHLDLIHPEFSALLGFHQYVSTLLFDESGSGRLALVWDTYASFQSWLSSNNANGHVRRLRRSLALVDCWAYRRHDSEIDRSVTAMCCMADQRVADLSQRKQDQCLSYYDSLALCCSEPGIEWQLKKQAVSSLSLRSEPR